MLQTQLVPSATELESQDCAAIAGIPQSIAAAATRTELEAEKTMMALTVGLGKGWGFGGGGQARRAMGGVRCTGETGVAGEGGRSEKVSCGLGGHVASEARGTQSLQEQLPAVKMEAQKGEAYTTLPPLPRPLLPPCPAPSSVPHPSRGGISRCPALSAQHAVLPPVDAERTSGRLYRKGRRRYFKFPPSPGQACNKAPGLSFPTPPGVIRWAVEDLRQLLQGQPQAPHPAHPLVESGAAI